ncbi:hypothetical protein [Metabacillus fastidiosus]|uniref:hypothetical protein n=1 Tax=Metabacillus fastidiosus TaxID=1458 RepID=UPI003D2E0657
MYSQVNNKVVAGLSELDITADLGGKPVATANTEGVVTGTRVELRVTGTEDFPFIDADGDRVYGKVEFIASPDGGITPDKFVLKFYSEQANGEAPYTFAADASNADFRYTLRTNLSVLPVDAIINGGAGFVEGATDANAYMNLIQLMKDIYGNSGTLDNDGNANLAKSILQQISEITTGANDLEERVTQLETKPEEEIYEAVGGETTYMLVKGLAEDKSVLLFINGQLQTPGINFEYIKNINNEIEGFNFSPDTLEIVDGTPDILYVKYNKIM